MPTAAEASPGVKAVITRKDFTSELEGDNWDILENVMAGEKVLYDGHALAAVAATSVFAARDALKLIEVEYEVLPHVTDVDEAMEDGAPVIREGAADASVPPGMHPNVVRYHENGHGDVEAGFAEADLVIEDSFRTEATHQGYIEPHACLAQLGPDGKGELWCCTQGHFVAGKICASLLGIDASQLRVTASEIGGGFGGKTTVFIEPVALALSAEDKPAGQGRHGSQRGVSGDGTHLICINGCEDRHEEGRDDNRCRRSVPASGWRVSRGADGVLGPCAPLLRIT